jgi:RNA 3'-terminal phosphate cyclase (ATP)
MLQLKGTLGVGGGHVLRTALTLAAVTKREVEIVDFASPDPAPGLRPRHLAAVQALAEVCGATVDGAVLNSKRLTFSPGACAAGDYVFDAGRGGSEPGYVSSIFQAVLPPLLLSGGASTVEVHGVTHGEGAATATWLQTVFAPTLRKFGVRGEVGVAQWGFAPTGEGVLRARIEPASVLRAVDFSDRGPMIQIGGIAVYPTGDLGGGERLKNRVTRRLAEVGRSAQISAQAMPVNPPGKLLFLLVVFERGIAGFSGVGTDSEPAEEVSDRAVNALFRYLQSQMVTEKGLAEDLLPFAALAEGTSVLSVEEITPRAVTTIEILKRFVPVRVEIAGRPGSPGELRVTGIGLRR